MSTLTVSGVVPLVIQALDPVGAHYVLSTGFGPGGSSSRRQTVESPFLPGRFLVAAVADVATAQVPVIAQADTAADLQDRLETLIAAFWQLSYTITLDFDGVAYAWTCERADYVIGDSGALSGPFLSQHAQLVTFTVPRSPNATGI